MADQPPVAKPRSRTRLIVQSAVSLVLVVVAAAAAAIFYYLLRGQAAKAARQPGVTSSL